MPHKPPITDADLARLKEERDRADRLYNEALTALDQALTTPAPLPSPAAGPDLGRLEGLNQAWQVLPANPVPFSGLRGRLGAFVWRLVGPMLQRQQEFNSALVDHLNRNAARETASAEAVGSLAAAVGEELAALARVQARLIGYLQQITLYVDTKDRHETGLLWHELRLRTDGLAAGLSALGDELLKGREHGLAYEQRLEGRLAEGLARVGAAAAAAPPAAAVPAPASPRAGARDSGEVPATSAAIARKQLAGEAASKAYAGFEDLYRGSVEEIGDRLAEYIPLFTDASEVLDIGCGRGEMLAALKAHGIAARGVDINPEMVARCRAQGLDVVEGEALAYLAGLADGSLGGLFAAQVVEHLEPERLLCLLDLAHAKLRPGARIVLETVNPACWAAFFSSYIRDITHVRPIHPDTLRYLLIARRFQNVDVRYSSPYPAEAKLRALPLTLVSESPAVGEVVRAFNRNAEILNQQLFSHLDYAAIGVKP